MRHFYPPLVVGILAFAPLSLSAQGPVGPEFQINTFTTNDQSSPAVSHGPGGEFAVVWASYQDGSSYGVFGQRFTSQGALAGGEFQINSFTTNDQIAPSVSHGPGGEFVVVWFGFDQDGSGTGVFGQRFTSQGALSGGEFQVNSFTTLAQRASSVSHAPSGGFAVMWQSADQDGSGTGVFGQRYAPAGATFTATATATPTSTRTSSATATASQPRTFTATTTVTSTLTPMPCD